MKKAIKKGIKRTMNLSLISYFLLNLTNPLFINDSEIQFQNIRVTPEKRYDYLFSKNNMKLNKTDYRNLSGYKFNEIFDRKKINKENVHSMNKIWTNMNEKGEEIGLDWTKNLLSIDGVVNHIIDSSTRNLVPPSQLAFICSVENKGKLNSDDNMHAFGLCQISPYVAHHFGFITDKEYEDLNLFYNKRDSIKNFYYDKIIKNKKRSDKKKLWSMRNKKLKELNQDMHKYVKTNLPQILEPKNQIEMAARYLKEMKYGYYRFRDLFRSTAGYNAGVHKIYNFLRGCPTDLCLYDWFKFRWEDKQSLKLAFRVHVLRKTISDVLDNKNPELEEYKQTAKTIQFMESIYSKRTIGVPDLELYRHNVENNDDVFFLRYVPNFKIEKSDLIPIVNSYLSQDKKIEELVFISLRFKERENYDLLKFKKKITEKMSYVPIKKEDILYGNGLEVKSEYITTPVYLKVSLIPKEKRSIDYLDKKQYYLLAKHLIKKVEDKMSSLKFTYD